MAEEADDLTEEIKATNGNEQDTELADGRQDRSLRRFPELITGETWTCTLWRTVKGTADVMLNLQLIRPERLPILVNKISLNIS